MELSGQRSILASPAAVWAALFNPAVLMTCIPGCKSVERKSDTDYLATMLLKVGPLTATFDAVIMLSEPEYPIAITLSGTLNGAAAGFSKGHARIRLLASGDTTELGYTAEVKVGGKLAAVGDRVFGAAVRRNIEEFFNAFAARVGETNAKLPADTVANNEVKALPAPVRGDGAE